MTDIVPNDDAIPSIQTEKQDIFERVLDILRVPLKDRTADQLGVLMKATESFQFFQDMNAKKRSRESDTHKRCCKRLKYETMLPGTTVFRLGQLPDKFYIVFKGSVNVLIQKDPGELRREIAEYKEKYTKTYEKALDIAENDNARAKVILDDYSKFDQEKLVYMLNKDVNYFGITGGIEPKQIDDIKHYFKDGVFVYNCVGNIGKGRIFGELGLIMKKTRATTIMVKEKADFGVMTKEDYEDILMNLEAERVYRKILMFKKYLPSQMGQETVTKFSYLFEKVKFKMSQHIYSKGDLSNKMFFIKFGQVLLYKTMDPAEEEAEKQSIKRDKNEAKDIVGLLNINAQQKKAKPVILPIQSFGIGQFFGEEEILQGKKKRVYGAICNSAQGTLYVASKDNFLSIINQRLDLNEFFKKLARLRSAWHEEHQNFLKNATTMTQSIIHNLNRVNVKTYRISANAIDREFNILKEHEKREAQDDHSSPVIRIQALTSEPRHKRVVAGLRGSLPNSKIKHDARLSQSPGQKHKSLENSLVDSIAGFERQVELNIQQVEKAIASSKAVGYKTLMNTGSETKRTLTPAEAFAKKKAAQEKDPNRHYEVAWKDIDLCQNLQHTAKKSVLEYLSTKLGSLNDPTKIRGLEPKRDMNSARSQRSLVRSSSSQRPFTKRSAAERSSPSLSGYESRPHTSAAVLRSMPLKKEPLNFIGAADGTPMSPEMTNRGSPFSPRLIQSDFYEKKSELGAIEERDITAKIEELVFQPQVGCYVNAEFPKLIPKLKFRTKSVSDDKRSRMSDSARTSTNDLAKLDRWNESEAIMPSGRSDGITDFVSTSHRPFYSTGNVYNVSKMKSLHQVIKSLKARKQ